MDCPNWFTGVAMYFRRALPVACRDVVKLNLYGCADSPTICEDPVLGIANVWVQVPSTPPPGIVDCRAQQGFALEVAHTAIQAAAARHSFPLEPFTEARQAVEQEHYVFRYQIGKSRQSPDRQYSAAVWCSFDAQFKTELIVTHRNGSLKCQYPFATGDETSVGQLMWQGNDRVHVPLTGVSGGAFWDCGLDGQFRFEFPKSSGDSPHHWYQHAVLLLEGPWVLPDEAAGRALLQRAADAGYKHAVRRVESRLTRSPADPANAGSDT